MEKPIEKQSVKTQEKKDKKTKVVKKKDKRTSTVIINCDGPFYLRFD